MKATSLLEFQHRKVEAIFKKLEAGKAEAAPLVTELSDLLAAHMAIEQDIFYPAVRGVDPDLVAEGFQEHAVAEVALKRLRLTAPRDPTFAAKVVALKELIEHHVREEEEELFPELQRALGAEALDVLGRKMSVAFREALERGFRALVPEGFDTTTADEAILIQEARENEKRRRAEKTARSRSGDAKSNAKGSGAGVHR